MRKGVLRIVVTSMVAISPLISAEEANDQPITVLSIDGGGVRGIIPAVFLQEIERRMEKPIADVFDIIAGTSTGGLLSLAFTCPDTTKITGQKFTADEIIEFYKSLSSDIFPKQSKVKVAGGFCKGALYSSDPLEKRLSENFGAVKLSQLTTHVLITAEDIKKECSHSFLSDEATDDSRDYFIRDIARATSAAPFYFKHTKIQTVENSHHQNKKFEYYQDGGTKNNNPAQLAFDKAKKLFKGRHIHLISLGTGESCTPPSSQKIENEGCCSRGARVGASIMDASAQNVHNTLLEAAQRGDLIYKRIQLSINQEYTGLDDPLNIEPLETIAKKYVDEENKKRGGIFDEIENLLRRMLVKHRSTSAFDEGVEARDSCEPFDEREKRVSGQFPENHQSNVLQSQSMHDQNIDHKSHEHPSTPSVHLGLVENNEGGVINTGQSFPSVRIVIDTIKRNKGGLINLGVKK